MRYCSTASPNLNEFRKKYTNEFLAKAHTDDNNDTLYISTRYVVIYNDDAQKLDLKRIQAGHQVLNKAFSKSNTEELDKVPDTKYYPWRPLIGDPNIQFLPINSSKLEVEYVYTSKKYLHSKTPLEDAASVAGVEDGVMNIYIGNCSDETLGQAILKSNTVFVLYSSIGGPDLTGLLPEYNLSKTLIHEVGHALSLPHTFSDDACDHTKVFQDVPEQVSPNYLTELFNNDGEWDCIGDNRHNDRVNKTNTSCLSIQTDPDASPNEMGINYMDYGIDHVSIMFTKHQSTMMRTFLKSTENTSLKFTTDEAIPYTSTTSENTHLSPTSEEKWYYTDNSLSSSAVLMMIFIVVLVVFVVHTGVRYTKNTRRV